MGKQRKDERRSGARIPQPAPRHGAMPAFGSADTGDSEGMKGGGMWISGAIKHPGSLRKSLGVKGDKPIPAAKLEAATHSRNPTTARRARLAETLKGFHK